MLPQLIGSRTWRGDGPPVGSAFAMPVEPDRKAERLTEADRAEILSFLAVRPVHTVVMASYIADNGIESELNRGSFYGYRGHGGELEGVALIGHSTLVEARTDKALRALAIKARSPEVPLHLIMSSGDAAEKFYAHLTEGLSEPRLVCRESLFEVAFPFAVRKTETELKAATIDQLIPIAEAQAEIALMECGVDPMTRDREGFLKRVARRIEQGRIFSIYEEGKLIFKADIIAETEDTIYLEGIYVHPDRRGRGLGSDCLAALTLKLLERVENICMLSNVEFESAHRSYYRAGFRRTDECITLFV